MHRLFALLLPFVLAPAAAQDRPPTRNPAIFLKQADWVQRLLLAKPSKIIVDPKQPENPLYIFEDSDPKSPTHGLKLCWLKLPKSSTALSVVNVQRSGAANTIYESAKEMDDLIVMNGGFFAFGNKNNFVPVGLVIASGNRISETKNWNVGGFVLQMHGVPTVLPVDKIHDFSEVEHAVQSKPMLIANSKIALKSDPKPAFNRSAVAVDRNGDIIVAGAFAENLDAVSLIEFSQFLAIPRSKGGPEAAYALNLDGGPDAHFYFPKVRLHLGYSGENFVPDVIRFSSIK